MGKISIEIRYKDMSFDLIKEIDELMLYINSDGDYAIIVNKSGDVLFELKADCGQNVAYLESHE